MFWVESAEVVFCCDGAGTSGLHDPWCDHAPWVEQEHWHNSQHLGVVDYSVTNSHGTYQCDSDECCGVPDWDDD